MRPYFDNWNQVPFQNLEKEMVASPEEEVIDEGERMFRTILEDGIDEEEEEEEEEERRNSNNDGNNNNNNGINNEDERSPFVKGKEEETKLVPSQLQKLRKIDSR